MNGKMKYWIKERFQLFFKSVPVAVLFGTDGEESGSYYIRLYMTVKNRDHI